MYELKVADKKDPTWDIWDIVPQHIQHFLVTVPPSFEVSQSILNSLLYIK